MSSSEIIDINTISINKDLWFQLLGDRLSFRYTGLPEDIHVTISFNQNSPDINLHISRNLVSSNKPKVEVCRVNKELLYQLQQHLGLSIFNSMLEPLELKSYHLFSDKCGYFSWDTLKEYLVQTAFEKHLVRGFRPVSRIKGKKKFKIEGDLSQPFELLTSSSRLSNVMLQNIRRVPRVYNTPTEGGIIFYKNKSFIAIRIFDVWYRIKENITLSQMLEAAIKPEFIRQLNKSMRKAIVLTRNANNYEEVKDAGLSIRLTFDSFQFRLPTWLTQIS